jgi:hypothetical protein
MPYGDNDYPNVDNFPVPSFRTPIPPPSVDPDAADLIYVAYNPFWAEVLGAATMALQEPSTWAGEHDDVILALNRANTFALMLQTPVTVGGDDLSPFWDDTDGADADGTPIESEYSYQDRLEDWVIAAFVASSGVPGAAALYLTIAPRFRLFFKTRNYGGIVRIFVDDVAMGDVDTYSAAPGLTFFDVVADAVT